MNMATADIQVTLREGESEGGFRRYEPGSEVAGAVTVTPDRDLNCRHLTVQLQWHTEGRGDRDQQTVDEVDVFQGTLPALVPSVYNFRLRLPREPWSYAGYYINIVWGVEVNIDVPFMANPKSNQRFVMVPRRA